MDTPHLALYLKAAGYGIAVAAPVGPMSLLCMRRTLTQGWRQGLATGAGIAIGDGVYALVAALGLAGVTRFMLAQERPLHLAAGLFLVGFGIKAFVARAPVDLPPADGTRSWPAALGSAVLLTLTNPPTIIMFAAVFTALAPRTGFAPAASVVTVAGVFTGSLAWWCGLVGAASSFRHVIGARPRRAIDRVAGTVLAVFGLTDIRTAVS